MWRIEFYPVHKKKTNKKTKKNLFLKRCFSGVGPMTVAMLMKVKTNRGVLNNAMRVEHAGQCKAEHQMSTRGQRWLIQIIVYSVQKESVARLYKH